MSLVTDRIGVVEPLLYHTSTDARSNSCPSLPNACTRILLIPGTSATLVTLHAAVTPLQRAKEPFTTIDRVLIALARPLRFTNGAVACGYPFTTPFVNEIVITAGICERIYALRFVANVFIATIVASGTSPVRYRSKIGNNCSGENVVFSNRSSSP